MILVESLLNRIPVMTVFTPSSIAYASACARRLDAVDRVFSCLHCTLAKLAPWPRQVLFHMLGFVGLWSCAYGVWAYYVYASQGRWIYPFLVRADDKTLSAFFQFLIACHAAVQCHTHPLPVCCRITRSLARLLRTLACLQFTGCTSSSYSN